MPPEGLGRHYPAGGAGAGRIRFSGKDPRSWRDTGFGGMGFTPASQGGTHIVERNLARLTVVVGVLFFVNTIALYHLLG